MANSGANSGQQALAEVTNLYYDDGSNSAGYASDSSQGGPLLSVGSM